MRSRPYATPRFLMRMAPIVWRLHALDVPLPSDGKAIEDYGNRIFRSPGFVRSLTSQEKNLRDLPA